MSRLTAVEAVVGYRNSYRLTKHARRGVARSGGGYPNLGANAKTPGRGHHGGPAGAKVPVARPAERPGSPVERPGRLVERPGNWLRNGGWYPLVVLLTFGLGSFIPFAHAGRRLARPGVQAAGSLYTLASFTAFVMLGYQTNVVFAVLAPVLLLGGMVAATSHLVVLSRQMGAPTRRTAKPRQAKPKKAEQEKRVDPALAKALDARAKRAQARELVAQDPLLAEELHIGRPDLGRTFDDGGLVDINHATAKAMASAFGIKPVDARTIIERRDERGGFANVDEMLVLVDLPVAAWDRIRDRSITLSA
jgi:DNA uptake protein ComE-like DNA-binding protein